MADVVRFSVVYVTCVCAVLYPDRVQSRDPGSVTLQTDQSAIPDTTQSPENVESNSTTPSLEQATVPVLEPNVSKEEAQNISNAQRSFLDTLLKDMDSRIRPVGHQNEGPVVVQVYFHVAGISSISEIKMEYQLDIYFRQNWVDPRLSYKLDDLSADSSKAYFKLGKDPRGLIWVPDVFFPNEKQSTLHDITVPNMMVKIHPNGEVIYSSRLTMVLSCEMQLSNFPLDNQTCSFDIESYSYETSELILKWKDDPVTFNDKLELPQFSLKLPIKTSTCTRTYSTGTFPCLKARFEMTRFFGYYLLQTYIPSGLIVILSWVAFWINKDAVPARISLSVVTVMTMVAQLAGSKASIPSVSYLKAVDVWMMMGMVFVFAALVEYAVVNSLDRRAKKLRIKKIADLEEMEKAIPKTGNVPNKVDKACRIAFPLAFAIFNVVYWPYYTNTTSTF